MGELVPLTMRNPYLRDVQVLLESKVDPPRGTELSYRCADRIAAGSIARFLRAEARRRRWERLVMEAIGRAASELLRNAAQRLV